MLTAMLRRHVFSGLLILAAFFFLLGPTTTDAAKLDVAPVMEKSASSPGNARLLKWQKELIKEDFPFTHRKAIGVLAKAYPDIDKKTLASWLADPAMVTAEIDGKQRYFSDFLKNIRFRNLPLLWKKTKGIRPFFDPLHDIVFPSKGSGYAEDQTQPYVSPITYQGEVAIDIPRKKLPKSGELEIWAPLPVATPSQKWPRVLWLKPEKYVTTVPRTDGDIGYVHFSFPLDQMKDDVTISIGFEFAHYQQRFQVDPAKVLPYRKGSELFRKYTRSYGNTAITKGIAAEARKVVGNENNPYLAARKIYHHVVDTIPYSFAPHATIQVLGLPESVYVFENRHGDCGAQSMFFSAMCRSQGIPARTSGGYQAVPGYEGTHFWAEVYIEGYGWIPVDPTVAEVADWSDEITEEQRREFKDFFFGNQDPYRFVIQKDVDVPMSPGLKETIFTANMPEFVVQSPAAVCTTCKVNPFDLVDDHTTITYFPVDH